MQVEGQHGEHTFGGERGGGVDAGDPGVWHRGAQHGEADRPGQCDVGDVAAPAE